jgi:hypothetical protein
MNATISAGLVSLGNARTMPSSGRTSAISMGLLQFAGNRIAVDLYPLAGRVGDVVTPWPLTAPSPQVGPVIVAAIG